MSASREKIIASLYAVSLLIENFDAHPFVISKVNLVLDIVRSAETSRWKNKKELDLALCAILYRTNFRVYTTSAFCALFNLFLHEGAIFGIGGIFLSQVKWKIY